MIDLLRVYVCFCLLNHISVVAEYNRTKRHPGYRDFEERLFRLDSCGILEVRQNVNRVIVQTRGFK